MLTYTADTDTIKDSLGAKFLEGLYIEKNNRYINQLSNANCSLKLMATGSGVDVMLYEVWADRPAHISPGDKPGLMEFYYILEGAVHLKPDGSDVILEKGQYFYVYNLKDNLQLETNSGAKILYISSQPVFGLLSEFYEDLYLFLKKSEEKDLYTHNHGLRVQMYSLKISEKLNLSNDMIATLQIASLFHDIGKYNVPDSILKKPDKLTNEEFDCIKRHSADSGEMLKEKFETRISEIAEQHHERLDGTGYPKGLTEGDIYLEAKIIAVADTYDAMTSDRAYRKGVSPKAAIDELRRFAGLHYDAKVVEALYEALLSDGVPVDA